MHPLFKKYDRETPAILELLNSVTLGTNGAHYSHLDTNERIQLADNRLHLTLERNNKVLSTVTFCRRGAHWYVRYFAFKNQFQSSGKKRSQSNKNNLLYRELNIFFNEVYRGDHGEWPISSFYAYVDPSNKKSLWLCQKLGFESKAKLSVQTFSRIRPKKSNRVELVDNWEEVESIITSNYKGYNYFFTSQTSKPPYYVIRDTNNEIIALTKITLANWEIKRMPGKFGGILTKIIPYIPGLNKLIRPKKHSFIASEAVIIKDDEPMLLEELFEGVLANQGQNLILWWVDNMDTTYSSVKRKVKWGLLDKLIGANDVELVVRQNPNMKATFNQNVPTFTSGFDFV